MNFGISTMPLEDYQLEKKLNLLNDAGIKYIEIKPQKGHFDFQDPKYLDGMKRKLKKNNIEVISMHMPTNGVDISLIDEYERVWSVREVEKTALALLRLGGAILVVHPGSKIKDAKLRGKRRIKSEKSLEELLKFCEHWGIKIALENTLPGKTGDSIHEILELVKMFNSRNLGICLDTGHCNITSNLYNHTDVVESLLEIKDYLCHLHIHDNSGREDEHLLPNEGTIDWNRFLCALENIRYSGMFMFEVRKKIKNEEMINNIGKLFQNLIQGKSNER